MAAGDFESSAYRLRSATDASWPAQFAYGRREGFWHRIGEAVRATARLIVPVVALLLSFIAVYLYLDTPVAMMGSDASWLTVGHLLVPVCFLSVHLTNRRYGPSYAFAQIVVALAIAVAFVMFAVPQLGELVPFRIAPDLRIAVASGGAFLGAGFLSIVVFDGARGPRWWTAPLFGLVSSVVLFCLIYYPAAYAGAAEWTHRMLTHMELLAGIAVLLLVPYWSLRAVVRPLPGFGGY
ncbi:MAG TPA: VUT family protein [Rhizomicrobium sp.]|nr:VUT family protein [Rhizomicrobium sp.]